MENNSKVSASSFVKEHWILVNWGPEQLLRLPKRMEYEMNKIFLAILVFIFFSPPQAVCGWLHTEGRSIKDSAGNVVMLRGVNMYIRLQNERTKYNAAKAMGANVVRLMLWKQDIEGNPGTLYPGEDQRGLTAIDDAVQWAHDAGLMVILEQQIWSFQVEPAPVEFLTDAALQESWLSMWCTLIDRYKNNDTVIGIDLMNEPWNIKNRPPNEVAVPLWESIAKNAVTKLRPHNPNLIFFIEGWGMLVQPMWSDFEFLQQPNTVISDHVYGYKPYQFLSDRYSIYTKQNIPVWLGEIGFLPNEVLFMIHQLNNFDQLGLHYTIYTFGASPWDSPYYIVSASYDLTSIGQIYSDHIKSLVALSPPKRLRIAY